MFYEKSVIELPEEEVTLEVLVKRVFGVLSKRRKICATIVLTAIKNIGLFYRPQIDCIDIEVPEVTLVGSFIRY